MSRRARSSSVVAAGLALALLGAGCAGTPVVIDNYVPAGIDRSSGRVVEGSGFSSQILILFPIGHNSRHQRAWEELVAKAPDCWITDVKLRESWVYMFIGTGYRSVFRATAYPKDGFTGWPDASPAGEPGAASE